MKILFIIFALCLAPLSSSANLGEEKVCDNALTYHPELFTNQEKSKCQTWLNARAAQQAAEAAAIQQDLAARQAEILARQKSLIRGLK